MSYEFVANMLRDAAGTQGMKFFPFVFSLFMFVLVANLLGLFPYFFTVTSHIIVTFALALLVIGTVVVYGFMKHGFGFLKLFVPHGVPVILLPLVVLIEVISFLSRPISLSVRLFANMLAGHITLKVFAGFVVSLSALGAVGVAGAILPLAMTVALTALEFLVAFLQAYVFAMLTCMYLNDALHPGPLGDPIGGAAASQNCNELSRSTRSWTHGSRSSKVQSARASPASAWAAPASALAHIFGNYLAGALRNPSAADGQFGRLIFGFAVTEALGIFSLLIALLLLFA